MAARANWKGYLKLSLVSCAIALYPATSSSTRVRFSTLHRETGNRVKRQYVDAGTGEPVQDEQQVKGYEVGKGSYIFVEDEDLDVIKIESTHTIDIESFVLREQVDQRYLDAPYYITPDDKVAQEAFSVIRDAMQDKRKAGLPALSSPAASGWFFSSRSARDCSPRCCATPTRCARKTLTSRISPSLSCRPR